jgi:hypothetical protein
MRNMKGGYEHVVSSHTLRQVGCGPTDIFQQSLSLLCGLLGSRTTRKIIERALSLDSGSCIHRSHDFMPALCDAALLHAQI